MRGIGAAGGLRAIVRLARRDAWRHKGRSSLIALMVALPVLILSVLSVVARSDELDPRDDVAIELGHRAQAVIEVYQPGTPIIQTLNNGWYTEKQFQQAISGQSEQSGDVDEPTPPRPSDQQLEAQVAALVPRGDRAVPDRQAGGSRDLIVGDRAVSADVREFNYTATDLDGMVTQVSGRAPRGAGEVAITQALAEHASMKVGDTFEYRGPMGDRAGSDVQTLTVSGIVGGAAQLREYEIIGLPGTLITGADRSSTDGYYDTSWVIAGPVPFTWDSVKAANQQGFTADSRNVLLDPPAELRHRDQQLRDTWRGQTDVNAIAAGAVVVGLILLQLALLAGPAIAVGARRSERTLALVSANGGVARQLRGIVLATSGVIGLVGCLIAAVLGAGLGTVAVIVLRTRFDQQLPRADIHLLDLAALVAVGTLTAVGAALVPARLAARLNVIAVLTGRRGQAAPKLRVPILGLVIAAAGAACTVVGSTQRSELLTVSGVAVCEIGLIMATGAIIALFARLGRSLPFAGRFALRDAARQRGRTVPAVAAVMAAIAGTVAAGVFLASQDHYYRSVFQPELPLGTVSYTLGATSPDGLGGDAQTHQADLQQAEQQLTRTLPVQDLVPLYGPQSSTDEATDLGLLLPPGQPCPGTPDFDRSLEKDGQVCYPSIPHSFSAFTSSVFGDQRTVEVLTGIAQPQAGEALAAGRVVTFSPQFIWPDGTVHVQVMRSKGSDQLPPRTTKLPATYVSSASPLNAPVFPVASATKLGLRLDASAVMSRTDRMPTKTEEERAAAALDKVDGGLLSIQRPYESQLGLTLLALIAAAALITLVGTLTAVGLARAEGVADVATLAAVGASPGVRRRLAAAQAGVIAGIGGALGLVTGLLVGWSVVRLLGVIYDDNGVFTVVGHVQTWPTVIPWFQVLLTVIGVPLLVVALSFVFTRSRLPLIRRVGQ